MKLEAHIPSGVGTMECLTPSSNWTRVPGGYYRAADVDALLASIREAVEAEREAVFRELNLRLSAPDHEVADTCQATDEARAALDALLSGEDA